MLAVHLADVVDAADVRVGDLQGGLDLVEEAVEARLIALHRLRQELQRHRLAELEVVGAVDLAHAAAAEQADDAVALGQDRARDEAGLVRCGMRDGGWLALQAGFRGCRSRCFEGIPTGTTTGFPFRTSAAHDGQVTIIHPGQRGQGTRAVSAPPVVGWLDYTTDGCHGTTDASRTLSASRRRQSAMSTGQIDLG